MTLFDLQKHLLPRIEAELKAFINAQDFSETPRLKEMLIYHMGWKAGGSSGKRIRPLLSLLCAGAFGTDPQIALPGAMAIEFLHNFTLIHDDIEDNSTIRHGQPTLWSKWGVPQAINAGDALFSIAQMAVLGLSQTCDPSTAARGALRLNQVCLHLTCGQHLDIAFETEEKITIESYLEMVRGKTGALIALCSWLGGLAAQLEAPLLDALYEFGENLGLAFQMLDDFLGIWGDPQVTGKSAASDILAHKKTLPIIFGLNHSAPFRSMWTKTNLSHDQIQMLTHSLQACGAQDYVKEQAQEFTNRAFKSLEFLFPKPNSYTKAIVELTENLLNRDF